MKGKTVKLLVPANSRKKEYGLTMDRQCIVNSREIPLGLYNFEYLKIETIMKQTIQTSVPPRANIIRIQRFEGFHGVTKFSDLPKLNLNCVYPRIY